MRPFHGTQNAYPSHLTIAANDSNMLAQYYQKLLGLQIQKQEDKFLLSSEGEIVLTIVSTNVPRTISDGLYHVAWLLEDDRRLANWIRHIVKERIPISGSADHLVSHAIYLEDPEGNGIEVYSDTDPSTWKKTSDGIQMDTLPLDLGTILSQEDESGIGSIRIGHLHLREKNLASAGRFYPLLGMDLIMDMYSAKFLSWGGYHHHIGMNRWDGNRLNPWREFAPGLAGFTITYPSTNDLNHVMAKLTEHQIKWTKDESGIHLKDPAGIPLLLRL